MQQIDYIYKNCPIPGGGYVTGFTFHPSLEGLCYARTDVGGLYRFEKSRWKSLSDHVKGIDNAESFPLSLALDPDRPEMLYSICDSHQNPYLCISNDFGESFTKIPIPFAAHGNIPGRSTGERLLYCKGRLYAASPNDGLFYSDDEGKSWKKLYVGEKPEKMLSLIHRTREGFLLVGCAGASNRKDTWIRGCTLYLSTDEGAHFTPMPVPSMGADNPNCKIAGFVPQRICEEGDYLYVSFICLGKYGWQDFRCYSGDSGAPADGRLYRYQLDDCGHCIQVTDITPEPELHCGIGGVDIKNGMLLCASVGSPIHDIIWCSTDCGTSFKRIIHNHEAGQCRIQTPYMKEAYNGGASCIHWISDIKINPLDPDMALFNTGTGIFCIRNLSAARAGENVIWEDLCEGLEETVHMHVKSLPKGKGRVLDLVGDLGGFIFSNLDTACENSFANEKGDRYITCLNGDYPSSNPNLLVVTPRGNWTGKTKGGLLLSHNQGENWKLLPYPYGLTVKIDKELDAMQKPNVNSGWTAISADGSRILWSLCREGMQQHFASDMTLFTDDEGAHWHQSSFYDINNNKICASLSVTIISDKVHPSLFYGICTENGHIFISRDKGASFYEKCPDGGQHNEALFRGPIHVDIRSSKHIKDESGHFYLAIDRQGLFHMCYQIDTDTLVAHSLLPAGDYARCIGIGIQESLFVVGCIEGCYGFFLSQDHGKSWCKINNDTQCFGQINSIDGDDREAGLWYLGSGGRGLFYGRPATRWHTPLKTF